MRVQAISFYAAYIAVEQNSVLDDIVARARRVAFTIVSKTERSNVAPRLELTHQKRRAQVVLFLMLVVGRKRSTSEFWRLHVYKCHLLIIAKMFNTFSWIHGFNSILIATVPSRNMYGVPNARNIHDYTKPI